MFSNDHLQLEPFSPMSCRCKSYRRSSSSLATLARAYEIAQRYKKTGSDRQSSHAADAARCMQFWFWSREGEQLRYVKMLMCQSIVS